MLYWSRTWCSALCNQVVVVVCCGKLLGKTSIRCKEERTYIRNNHNCEPRHYCKKIHYFKTRYCNHQMWLGFFLIQWLQRDCLSRTGIIGKLQSTAWAGFSCHCVLWHWLSFIAAQLLVKWSSEPTGEYWPTVLRSDVGFRHAYTHVCMYVEGLSKHARTRKQLQNCRWSVKRGNN